MSSGLFLHPTELATLVDFIRKIVKYGLGKNLSWMFLNMTVKFMTILPRTEITECV